MKKRIKRMFLVVLALLLSGALHTHAEAVTTAKTEQEPALEDYLLEEEWSDFFAQQEFSFEQLREMSFPQMLQALWELLLEKLRTPAKTALRIVLLLFLLSVFRLLCRESAPPELEYTLQSVLTVVLFLMLSEPVLQLLTDFQENIERCRVFLAQFVPVMGSILAAGGQSGTAAVYTTVFFGVIMAVSQALYGVVSPLIRAFLAISVTRGMCGSLQLDGVLTLFRKTVHWIMGLAATLFGAYLGFQSVLANAADSLTMKAGRFVLSGGVPIVGGAVSEAIGTVYTGLKLVKSAAGTVGIAALLLLFLPQLLQCIVYTFLCRGCAAAAQLLENPSAKGLLDGVADSIAMLQAVLVLYLVLTVLATALMVLLNTGSV